MTWLDRADREVLARAPARRPGEPRAGGVQHTVGDPPNPVGLHRVTVLSIDGLRLRVRHLEALDGTPIIDVKPPLKGIAER